MSPSHHRDSDDLPPGAIVGGASATPLGGMDVEASEIARSSIQSIRAAAASWGDEVTPDERRRRIRSYLARTAQGASIEAHDFAARIVELLPAPIAAEGSIRPAPTPVREPEPPGDPVDRIGSMIDALSDDDRRRLIASLREKGILPPEPPRERPVAPAPVAPAPRAAPAAMLGDAAFLELLDGLGLLRAEERPGGRDGPSPAQFAEIEARFAHQGIRRASLTPDLVAIALAHLSRAIGEFSEEHDANPRGLPEAIRQVLPNTCRAPVQRLRDYLAGAGDCDADELRNYLSDYFEPYRSLSERLPRLCERLSSVGGAINPAILEQAMPKGVLGRIAYDRLWETYRDEYARHVAKGLGGSKEQARTWLFRQWLT